MILHHSVGVWKTLHLNDALVSNIVTIMALAASPPPAQALSEAQQAQVDRLDEQIAGAHAELASFTKRNCVLAGALLASSAVQSQLEHHLESEPDAALSRLLHNRQLHTITSVHRLAFGVTSFTFEDPSPDTPDESLLGIRFDIYRTGGAPEAPYFILCRRLGRHSQALAVYKHTVPAFIPIALYQELYLGVQDEAYASESLLSPDYNGLPQSLIRLVSAVRADLVAWRLRQDAIRAIQDELKIPASGGGSATTLPASAYGVCSFEAVAEDAHYARIGWHNGYLGRVKIGKALQIDQAVVFGRIDGEEQRCVDFEAALLGGDSQLDSLVSRLRSLPRTG